MIGLVVVLALAVIIPVFDHDLSPGMEIILDGVNYIVIAAFIAEYVLKLYVEDKSRISFITNPLHILDLLIIIIALLDFSKLALGLPIISNQGELSPMLRLLRVPLRGVLAIGLASKAKTIADREEPLKPPQPPKHLKIATLDEKGIPKDYQKGDPLRWKEDKPIWIDFQDVTEGDLVFIEEATEIPREEIKKKLIEGSFPRIDYIGEVPSILLWDSRIENQLNLTSPRMLVVLRAGKIITLTTEESKIFARIHYPKMQPKDENLILEVLYSLLQVKINDYGMIVQEIESKVNEFERIAIDKTSPKFLHKTFLLKKEIQQVSDNLWHFHQVLDQIINKEDLLHLAVNDNHRRSFITLHSESKYICRTARNIKESLNSLIELHINNGTCLAPYQSFLNLPQNVFRPEKLNNMRIILIH